MKTTLIKIYSCDYCSAYYKREHFAKQHETKCKNNPVNYRACFDCVHSEKRKVDSYSAYQDESFEMEVVFCKKKDMGIYPPDIERKGNAVELRDFKNTPMPKECKDQLILEESLDDGNLNYWLFTYNTKA